MAKKKKDSVLDKKQELASTALKKLKKILEHKDLKFSSNRLIVSSMMKMFNTISLGIAKHGDYVLTAIDIDEYIERYLDIARRNKESEQIK
jgi:hypothetical protein